MSEGSCAHSVQAELTSLSWSLFVLLASATSCASWLKRIVETVLTRFSTAFFALRSAPWAYVPREEASYRLTMPVVELHVDQPVSFMR